MIEKNHLFECRINKALGLPMIITHHGEAKVILQDIHLYEQPQESLALLKILTQSSGSIERGEYKPAREAFTAIRKRIAQKKFHEVSGESERRCRE